MIILRKKFIKENLPEQKEFNIVSDIYHSGIKRAYKKNVGKTRKSIGNYFDKLYKNKINKQRLRIKESEELGRKVKDNPELLNKLEKEAKSRGLKVYKDNGLNKTKTYNFGKNRKNSSFIFTPNKKDKINAKIKTTNKALNTKIKKEQLEVYKDTIDNKSLINIAEGTSNKTGMLSHEIGHDMNTDKKITNAIHNYNSKLKNPSNRGSIINSIKRRIIEPIEERNATNNGLKLMKKLGADREELNSVKKAGRAANKTHKVARSADIYKNIRDKIQIPSIVKKYNKKRKK